MRLTILFLIVCAFFGAKKAHAQDPTPCDSVYIIVDEEPEFDGGLSALMKWLLPNLEYPSNEAVSEIEKTGKILVTFIISEEGKILRVSIQDLDAMPTLQEARKSAPTIKPAKINSKPVCAEVVLPINIQLN